jgi:hypothetical protein
MKTLHPYENSKYDWVKQTIIDLTPEDQIRWIFRGNRTNKGFVKVQQFEVILCAKINDKIVDIRRHCWMPYHREFHTHVLTKLVGKGKRIILQTPLKNPSLEKAKEWAKKDMENMWFFYKRNFKKRIKQSTIKERQS